MDGTQMKATRLYTRAYISRNHSYSKNDVDTYEELANMEIVVPPPKQPT